MQEAEVMQEAERCRKQKCARQQKQSEEESKICGSCSDLSAIIPLQHERGVSEQMWGALPSCMK